MPFIPTSSIAASLGSSLGTGLSRPINDALDSLAKSKLQSLLSSQQQQERDRYAKGLEPLLGQKTSSFIANLGPDERKIALQNLGPLTQLESLLSGNQAQNPALTGILQPQNNRSQQIADIFTSPREKREQEKLELQKQQVETDIGEKARKFSEPYRSKAESSRANIRDYKLLEGLAEKGNLRSGKTQQILTKLGLGDFALNYDSQLASKLSARLGQNAQSAFGTGRLTNFLEQTFQKSLPSLWNTPEGIIAISKINSFADQANIIKDDIRKELIRNNKGKLPYDIDDQIEDKARPVINELEDKAIQVALNPTTRVIKKFSSPTDANPALFNGKKLRNPTTGEVLVSNGKEWIKE